MDDTEDHDKEPDEIADERDDPALATLLAERNERVRRVVDALPDRARTVVFLRYFRGLSSRSIGKALGITAARAFGIEFLALQQLVRLMPADLAEARR